MASRADRESGVSIDALKRSVLYCPLGGHFWWKYRPDMPNCWNARYAGKRAFVTVDAYGYLQGKLNGKPIKAHRVAFALWNGFWPEQVDHINGIRDDNRYTNLRASTNAENGRNQRKYSNNSSGVTGVRWRKDRHKWEATIRKINLGLFTDLKDATAARRAAEKRYGYDALHGRSDALRASRDLLTKKTAS